MMESIKKLREMTGAGMMDVKKALTDAGGDEEKAVALLRERGIVKAAKKADREATDGLVRAFVSSDGKVAGLVEINSETDFVARNADFQKLVAEFAQHVAENAGVDGAVDVEALATQKFLGGEQSAGDYLAANISKIGENLVLHRAVRFSSTAGMVVAYVHQNDKIGVLVELEGGDAALAKDIALHIAAERPRYLSRDEVNTDDLEKEKEILTNKALNEGKPANIVEKIVTGQLAKFYEENVLLEQKFVKDNEKTIKALVGDAKIVRFARFEIGNK
ncbi:MAG: translation elongation factor Ts [Deinococcales bacterium]